MDATSPQPDQPDAALGDRIESATLVLFRKGAPGGPPQVLMVERAGALRFAGGAAVFPGGKVDPADRELARAWLSSSGAGLGNAAARIAALDDAARIATLIDAAARIAALRETLEETGLLFGLTQPISASEARAARALLHECGDLGVVLDRFGWQFELDALIPFAFWREPRVGGFDTRFYLADLGTGAVDISVDQTENSRAFWASASESLALAKAGALKLIFPTGRNLERLAQFDSFAQACADAIAYPQHPITPRKEMREGVPWLTIPAGLGYPVLGEPLAGVLRA